MFELNLLLFDNTKPCTCENCPYRGVDGMRNTCAYGKLDQDYKKQVFNQSPEFHDDELNQDCMYGLTEREAHAALYNDLKAAIAYLRAIERLASACDTYSKERKIDDRIAHEAGYIKDYASAIAETLSKLDL